MNGVVGDNFMFDKAQSRPDLLLLLSLLLVILMYPMLDRDDCRTHLMIIANSCGPRLLSGG